MGFRNEGRSYAAPGGGKFWSVTTSLGVIDKSGALTQWAASTAADFIRKEVYEQYDPNANVVRIDPVWFEGIISRAKKEFRRVKAEAADIGTTVHRLMEGWARAQIAKTEFHPPQGVDPRVENSWGLFMEWAKSVDLTPVEVEQTISHPRHEYAGTLDLVAYMRPPGKRKKRLYLLDTKTSKDFYSTFGPQISAYLEGYKILRPEAEVAGIGVIRVGKEDGVPEFRDYTEHHTANFELFLTAHRLYTLLNGRP